MELGSGSSALGALRAFATSCCPQSERKTGGGCCADALALAMSPPPASDEFAHEVAATFVFADEMKTVRQLQSKCKEGRELVNVIYCSRSCARAFPPGVVADEAAPNKMKQYHHAIFAVLQPQMEKIKQLNEYCAQAVVLLSDNIQRTTVHENMTRVIPDVMMDALVDIMDVILQLNHLHDSKSSLRNDFSVFKRVFLHIKDDLPDAETIEKDIARLQEFMGSSYQAKGAVWGSLRHNLTNVKRYEQVTYLLLRHCVNHIENDTCPTPSSRFKYIRALSYLMAVLEGSDVWKKTNTLPGADKKVIEAAVKLIARFPVIPMLLEASIKPVKALQSQSSYRLESSNGASSSKNRDAMFDIVAASRECKSTCETFLPRLMHTLNSTTNREHTQEQNDTLCEVLVDGIAHLCKWKSNFLLFMAWKYQNPKTSEKLREAGIPMDSPLLEYERVTKHNYSDEEWQAMADIIYGVKSVVQILRGFQSKLAKCVRRTVYQHIQVFVQHTLLPILHRADKRKLACTKLIHDIRAMNGDWIDSELLVSDFKKKHKERKYSQIPDRTASPSLCQIQMLRTAIDSVYARRSMGDLNAKSSTSSVLFSFKKDLDSSDAETLQEFYHKAGAFPVLLDLSATLSELADFSGLWFREQYLELAKSVQIPAEISLPWLLIEHSLDGAFTSVEPVLAILDAYNDAGKCSLHELHQQHLYDEIEAEGKLCFDHFVFLLAERVYLHYKSLAAKDACREWSDHGSASGRNLPVKSAAGAAVAKLNPTLLSLNKALDSEEEDSKYESVLTQRHVSIFGRNYDLTFQLEQRVDALLRKDLEGWFTKFEASDATCYVAMLDILNVLKKTHSSLSNFRLDGFDDIFEEINDESLECLLESSLSLDGPIQSRVHEQISQTIRTDLCQHFSLKFDNWLFTRMPLHEALMLTVGDQFAHEECLRKAKQHRLSRGSIFRTKLGNSAAVKAAKYGALEKTITGTHRTFFGEPHVQALCELLPRRELVDVANDCIEFAVTKIEDVLALCIPALGSTIPPFRLPRFMYRTEGCYGYFEGKFKHLLDSDELEAQIFHCFREIGNALMFLLVLGTVLNVSAIQSNATQQSANSTERLPSLFQCALERIDSMLKRSEIAFEWEAGPDSQPEKMPNASSFYHVWCALEFLSCNRPRGGGDYSLDQGESLSLREMFGDGVQLAGCTLVHLLGQRTLYDLWNVSQHVINVRHYEDVKATSEAQVTLVSNSKKSRHKGELPNVQTTVGTLDQEMEDKAARFVVNAREMGATSKQIFHTLELAWPSGPRPAATFTPPQFTPPVNTPSSPLAAQYHR
ncbi:hypothetical protein PR002_g4545 [Phytophthora rubi]|uniref:CYRIA/CYRIB Rac1 binding domain-containing protein n=1 Tax=Phytophthora rubi TaxID=129364 RepID=A0A6A3NAF9_9STRA|nr:hypothetical protein PR002_g4545 [Phytophthora rubi]